MIPTCSIRWHLAGALLLAVAALAPAGANAQEAGPTAAPQTPVSPAPTQPVPPQPAPASPDPSVPATGVPETAAPAANAPSDAAPSVQDAPQAVPPTPAVAPASPAGESEPQALPAAPAQPTMPLPAATEGDVTVETGDVAGSSMGHDLSPWGMFMAADWVVQAVMVGLVFASLVTWTIWLAKALELAMAKRRARTQVRRIERAGSLIGAIEDGRRPLKRGPVASLALTAAAESELSGRLPADGVKERVAVALQRIEARSGRQMARGTGVLATIGSTAPFVGLFGTVWGIMNSFIGIAETNTTNLAVVAPGIAEALLATGIGLVAAIPAVIIYNVFARSIAGYRAILADGSAAVMRHLSRDLDRRDAGHSAAYAQPAE